MNNLAIANNETPAELQLRQTSRDLCEAAEEVMIMTRHDLSQATDLVKIIKTRSKEIEDERKRLVDPFNQGVKAINARFKAMTGPLEEAESSVKTKMLSFQKEEEKRAREEQERITKAQREAEERKRHEAKVETDIDDIRSMPLPAAPIEIIAPAHRPTTYGQTGAVSTVKKVWAFEVVDIRALANVRPDLVAVDTVKVNQLIRGIGGELPGLRIFENEIMQVR